MDESNLLTLEQLAELYPPPNLQLLEAFAPKEAHPALAELGSKIRSSRILVDQRRLYGTAHAAWIAASEDTKELVLIGFSADLFSLAVDRAKALAELTAGAEKEIHADDSTLAARRTDARTEFTTGLALRDQAAGVLTTVAGPDATWKTRVRSAVGTAADGDDLANGLTRLAGVGRDMLNDPGAPVFVRATALRLTLPYLARLDDKAASIRKTAKAATPRTPSRQTTQGDIDLLDGINLTLLSAIVHAFDKAHDIDPTLPRLVPISTRRLLGKHSRGVSAPTVPVPPAVP